MNKSRRGFISVAGTLGLGVFASGLSKDVMAGSKKKAEVAADDVLIAMPSEKYYAIPKNDLSQYAVSKELFAAEETRRLEASEDVVSRGKSNPPKRPPPRTAALGVRG